MHPAGAFKVTDPERLGAVVRERAFATVIGADAGRPLAARAPVLLEDRRLRFHLSRSNALTPVFQAGGRVLAVVDGPDAYVSPDWYAADNQVPTWNYVSVEIEGTAQPLERDGAISLLDDLAVRFEARLGPKPPWGRHKMTPAGFEALLGGIVAFEAAVDRLEGVFKLSQNKPAGEIERVAAELARGDTGDQDIARLMRNP